MGEKKKEEKNFICYLFEGREKERRKREKNDFFYFI